MCHAEQITPETLRTALDRAKRSVDGGAELARRMMRAGAKRITGQAISQWTRVPAERVAHVEAATGIPREQLRPDLYRREPQNGSATP